MCIVLYNIDATRTGLRHTHNVLYIGTIVRSLRLVHLIDRKIILFGYMYNVFCIYIILYTYISIHRT